jgi:hypothetical protein
VMGRVTALCSLCYWWPYARLSSTFIRGQLFVATAMCAGLMPIVGSARRSRCSLAANYASLDKNQPRDT